MRTTLALSLAVSALAIGAASAQTRQNIQIAGSSTVLPFSSIVAEEFGATFPEFVTPVVASGGTGGGMRQFCEGVGPNTIDIANASRAMRPAEIEACQANGVTDIREIMFGFDGIVFATRTTRNAFALEPRHVFLAISAALPEGTAQPTNWNQVDPSFADQRILLAIPASNHGTREVFEERVIIPGCRAVWGDSNRAAADCLTLRQDNVIEIVGDYTETLARLNSDEDTMGVFGLSFYDQNRDTLQVATMNGVTPSLETIANGSYPVSRPLFFYVKGEHIGVIPGLEEFTEFFMSEGINGPGGPLEAAGLIPAPRDQIETYLENFRNGVALGR